jgi:hypothetical protein
MDSLPKFVRFAGFKIDRFVANTADGEIRLSPSQGSLLANHQLHKRPMPDLGPAEGCVSGTHSITYRTHVCQKAYKRRKRSGAVRLANSWSLLSILGFPIATLHLLIYAEVLFDTGQR